MSDEDWDDPNYVAPVASAERIIRSYEKPQNDDYARGRRGGRTYYDNKSADDRYAEGGAGGGRRRDSVDQGHSEYLSIPSDAIGGIIGRGGANIMRLQNDYQVRIHVDRSQLTVKVSGNRKEDVKDAVENLRNKIEGDHNSGGRKRYAGESRGAGGSYEQRPRVNGNYGRSSYDFRPPSPTEPPPTDDMTGVIDWTALHAASKRAQIERWAKCPPLTKDFYNECPEVANMSQLEVDRIRAENNNTTVSHVFEPKEGDVLPAIPNPVWRFDQCFGDYSDLLQEIQKQGFPKPSPIQSQAWPILLKGHDMIGIAQTGTGKTLAFLLPGMIHTEYQSKPRGTRGGANVLVLAPTRELALQIETEVNKYSFRNMRAVCVYGGGSRNMQISDLERGAEILICTPGRLNDLVQAGVIEITTITYLVLDEADRMLDMGFEPQIRKLLLDIRPDRQTIMTSATWPPGVRRLAQSYMNNPMQVCVGSLDLAATHSVKQVIELLEDDQEKYDAIKAFCKGMSKMDKIIIFCGRKARADDLSSNLTLGGFYTQSIHGNRDQQDREQAISDIKTGHVRILVATDVASRGLDIEDITHVINYDFPRNIEEYVHRVGRTGRAGRSGTSISFFTRDDWGMAKELIDILEEADQEVPQSLRNMATRFAAMKERRAAEGGGRGGRGGGGNRGYRRYN